MGIFNNFGISASGLTAQRLRMDTIASNIANIETTRTPEGGPYQRQVPLFSSRLPDRPGQPGGGVEVLGLLRDQSPFKRVYEPGHPDADEEGYVLMPNVELVKEMVDMIDASRAYEANVTALNASKDMVQRALDIGRRG